MGGYRVKDDRADEVRMHVDNIVQRVWQNERRAYGASYDEDLERITLLGNFLDRLVDSLQPTIHGRTCEHTPHTHMMYIRENRHGGSRTKKREHLRR